MSFYDCLKRFIFLCHFNVLSKNCQIWSCYTYASFAFNGLCLFIPRPLFWSILAFRILGNCLPQFFTTVSQQMGNLIKILWSLKPRLAKTVSCCFVVSLPCLPWTWLHWTISPPLKRKTTIYFLSFSLYKLVCQFLNISLHKYHYTNSPTTKNAMPCIIVYLVIYYMASDEGT